MNLASSDQVPPELFPPPAPVAPRSRVGVDACEDGLCHRRGQSNGVTACVDAHCHRCVGTHNLVCRTLVLWIWMNDGRDADGGDADDVSSCGPCCGRDDVFLDRPSRAVSLYLPRPRPFQNLLKSLSDSSKLVELGEL